MRVITGTAGGRNLVTPEGMDVRPTVDRVKEGVFSAIQFDVEGRTVLDLFSGSGQLGIEALSRGAKRAVFVDNSSKSLNATKENLKTTELESFSKVINSDSLFFLKNNQEVFDIAFIDPPYNFGLTDKVLNKLIDHMSDYGIIICEHSKNEVIAENYGKFKVRKDYKYGKVFVTIFRTV